MVSSFVRRSSYDLAFRTASNATNPRTSSIDYGVASSTMASCKQQLTKTSTARHLQTTVIAQGPAVAFFGSCVIDDIFYIHGGVKRRSDFEPSNRMFKFQNNVWTDITTADSPTLSYHQCIVMGNGQYIVAIGGWDGSKRKSDVYVFDVVNGRWYSTYAPGFPSDGGLNNHAAIPLKSHETSILVIGRDGSLRTQRKHGDAYCLYGDPNERNFR